MLEDKQQGPEEAGHILEANTKFANFFFFFKDKSFSST